MTRVTGLHAPDRRVDTSAQWLDALLEFVKWSQGQTPLKPALESLASCLGAEAICMSRSERVKSDVRLVQTSDQNVDTRKPSLAQSFALEMLGDHRNSLKLGAFVLLSDARFERLARDPSLHGWMRKRGISEIGILCVGVNQGVRDLIEVHFTRTLNKSEVAETVRIGAALAEVFAGRRPGLVEHLLLKQSRNYQRTRGEISDEAILAPENPAGLTRSEWRLCALIANGLSREGAAQQLSVTNNTIRSHLRNIYAKTGHETFHDLARRLVATQEQRNIHFDYEERAA